MYTQLELFFKIVILATMLLLSVQAPSSLTKRFNFSTSDIKDIKDRQWVSCLQITSDRTMLVTGDYDNDVKIWNLSPAGMNDSETGYATFFKNITYTEWINDLTILPVSGQVFVVTDDGKFSVLDPAANYTEINPTPTYPGAWRASTIKLDSTAQVIYASGYEGVGTGKPPKIRKFNTATPFAQIMPTIDLTYPAESDIISMILIDDQIAIVVDSINAPPFNLGIYDVTTQAQIKKFQPATGQSTNLAYSPKFDNIYLGSKDKTIRTLSKSPITGQYEVLVTTYINDFGQGVPREMSTEFQGYLFAIVDNFLVEFQLDLYGRPILSQNFSFDYQGISLDIKYPYVAVGDVKGNVIVFEFQQPRQVETPFPYVILTVCLIIGFLLIGLTGFLIWKYTTCCKKQSQENKKLNQTGAELELNQLHKGNPNNSNNESQSSQNQKKEYEKKVKIEKMHEQSKNFISSGASIA